MVALSIGQKVMNGKPWGPIGVIRFGNIEYAELVQRTMSLTVAMSVNSDDTRCCQSSHPDIPYAAHADALKGVIMRDDPFGSKPIVAPRLSRLVSPLRL